MIMMVKVKKKSLLAASASASASASAPAPAPASVILVILLLSTFNGGLSVDNHEFSKLENEDHSNEQEQGLQLFDFQNGTNIDMIDINDDSCFSHSNCSSCTEASMLCHWCEFDSRCHTKGSIHGCSIGASCDSASNSNQTAAPTPSPTASTPKSDSCAAQTNCTSCIASNIFCHWCDFDSKCHTKGSIHGCAIGATCKDKPPPDNNPDSNKCSSHKNCTECTLSSHTCHWCAFDEKCHVIGSWWGCTHGVNCFNNDRCKRLEPERISRSDRNGDGWGSSIGFWPIFIIVFTGVVCCCCSSLCFVTVRAVKGAYDDWATVNYDMVDDSGTSTNDHGDDQNNNDGSIISVNGIGNRSTNSNRSGNIDFDTFQNNHRLIGNTLSNIEEGEEVENKGGDNDGGDDNDCDNDNSHLSQSLLPRESEDQHDKEYENGNETKVENDGDDACDTDMNMDAAEQYTDHPTTTTSTTTVTAHPSSNRLPPQRSMSGNISRSIHHLQPTSSNQVKCFYNTCLIWYILSIATASIFTFGAIYYFPKVPQFNVCSDEFAWNSIIDSLTSLKVEASFQVLASVENRNHLDITMDGVGGSFRHNGEDIGTFSMPTTTIAADSITDLLVTCSVRPDKWEALGLISDYYRGKLEFLINVNGNAKIKGIGYSIPVVVKDMLVKVNDPSMDDRHLCHCPEWKDLYPTASPLSFQDAVERPILRDRLDAVAFER